MTLFLTMILYHLFFIDDYVLYQQNRYQKDRTFLSLKIHLSSLIVACGYYLTYHLCTFLFPHDPLFFDLILLVGVNEKFRLIKKTIKQLHFTKRMLRFMCINSLFLVVLFILFHGVKMELAVIFIMIAFIFHSYWFYGIVVLMHPIEEKIRHHFVLKAKEKLLNYPGLIIGITGSYGKTSIKDILTQVLSFMYVTLKTPYSYNNHMGISKTILEQLTPQHEIFVCEMGADHVHEIEDLAHFVNPKMGIVSAIGPQHLSTFKSIENILHEKLQLLESLPETGVGFINQDNRYLREYDYQLKCRLVTVGIHYPSDFQALHVTCGKAGSRFDVNIKGELVPFQIQLLGEHNILNCLFAIAVANELNIPMNVVQGVLQTIPPIAHRLELKRMGLGMCIDNAYNSNPDSARLSLSVLKQMPHDRYCITPGFLDLGKEDDFYSFEFGKQLAQVCDWVILIGPCPKIEEGLKIKSFEPSHIVHCPTMRQALHMVSHQMKNGDICLIENDIPEIFTTSSL